MATQIAELTKVFQQIAVDWKAINVKIGNLSSLSTTEKTSLVGAINELKTAIASATGINDSAVSSSSTYSSSKIQEQITAAVTELLGGAAPATLNSLFEIANALNNDPGVVAGITTALGKRVRVDQAQSFTAPEQAQARANIGALSQIEIGDPATDLLAIYTAAKV